MRTYQQCRLERGNAYDVAWIPSTFAIKDKYVKIKKKGEWDDGWKVVSVSDHKMDEKTVLARRDDYRNCTGEVGI